MQDILDYTGSHYKRHICLSLSSEESSAGWGRKIPGCFNHAVKSVSNEGFFHPQQCCFWGTG